MGSHLDLIVQATQVWKAYVEHEFQNPEGWGMGSREGSKQYSVIQCSVKARRQTAARDQKSEARSQRTEDREPEARASARGTPQFYPPQPNRASRQQGNADDADGRRFSQMDDREKKCVDDRGRAGERGKS